MQMILCFSGVNQMLTAEKCTFLGKKNNGHTKEFMIYYSTIDRYREVFCSKGDTVEIALSNV